MTREQQIILEILKAIKKICEENEIKYYLAYGTLLGAVRHGGFIPWDDDIDIVMKREDYERFVKVAPQSLPNYYRLRKPGDETYPFSFAKVDDIRTTKIELNSQKSKYISGCWVDIFPLDGRPNTEKQCKKFEFKCRVKLFLANIKTRTCKGEKDISKIKKFLYMIGRPNNIPRTMLRLEKFMKKFSVDESIEWVSAGDITDRKTKMPKMFLNEQANYTFEGELFTSFKNVEGYLKYFYGDYMKLPPECERVPHPVKLLDLDKSCKKYEF